MAKQTAVEKKILGKVAFWASSIGAVVLIVVAGLAWWGGTFATGMVHDNLVAQNIYFPAAGSKGFEASEFPDLQKYAGQQVDNGAKAKAYADGYIGRHLEKVANGKAYAEVSAAAMAAPTDQKLAGQKATLFQGETLRGILLGTAYAYGTIGMIAQYVAVASGVVAVGLLIFALTKVKYLK